MRDITTRPRRLRKKQSDSRKGAKHAKAGNGIRVDCLGNVVPSVFRARRVSWRSSRLGAMIGLNR